MARFRPRLRFSLRTLFVGVTLCACASPVLPVLIKEYREWRSRVEWSEVGGPGSIRVFSSTSGCYLEEQTPADEGFEESEASDIANENQ